MTAFATEPATLPFENDQVKVIRALEKAHVKGKFHEHKPNRVMIYLGAGRQRFEYQDGRQPEVFDWKPGQVVWSKADGMHSPEVIGDEPFSIIEVELKKPGTGKTLSGPHDALKADPKHYKMEFENDQVRVLRVKLGAHETTPMIAHSVNSVAVLLTPAPTHKAGEATWKPAGTYKDENPGDSPVEMVVVEVKD
jgi:mannose-6-phosphate isomerase-like protein (cupin superfamily)